jgi:hypothetical protein
VAILPQTWGWLSFVAIHDIYENIGESIKNAIQMLLFSIYVFKYLKLTF